MVVRTWHRHWGVHVRYRCEPVGMGHWGRHVGLDRSRCRHMHRGWGRHMDGALTDHGGRGGNMVCSKAWNRSWCIDR